MKSVKVRKTRKDYYKLEVTKEISYLNGIRNPGMNRKLSRRPGVIRIRSRT